MENLVALVSALAWPLTVLILVFLFRRELRHAAGRLSLLKYKEFQAEFGRELAQVERKIEQLPSASSTNGSQESARHAAGDVSSDERLLRLAEISPRAAITEAWRDVELTTRAAAEAYGIAERGTIAGTRVIQELVRRGLLPGGVANAYGTMRQLRNEAVHATEFSVGRDEAVRYGAVAKELQKELVDLIDRAKEHKRE